MRDMRVLTKRLEPTNQFDRFEESEIFQGIHQRFEKQAKKYAHRIAVKDPERALTYAELDNAANSVAQAIIKKAGRGAGQVAFVLQNDAYAIVALLGILKAGKSYVPLDPLFPKERTSFMLNSSESKLILTDYAHHGIAQDISGGKLPMLLLDEIELKASADSPNCKVDPESMAYILFTSGSTGQPKGIAFGHRNLLHTKMCLI